MGGSKCLDLCFSTIICQDAEVILKNPHLTHQDSDTVFLSEAQLLYL